MIKGAHDFPSTTKQNMDLGLPATHRQLLTTAFREAFFHHNVADGVDRIMSTAETVRQNLEKAAAVGAKPFDYQPLDTVKELVTAVDPSLSPDYVEIIASSLQFWRMHVAKSHGDETRVVGTLLGQVGRSYLVEDEKRIIFRWYKDYDGLIQPPVICSIIREHLVNPTDFPSVVVGLAMVPPDVRKFYFWAHLQSK